MHVHVLQHVPFEGLGSLESWLRETRATVTWTKFFESTALPAPVTVDLIIALGGPMSANDEDRLPWLLPEKEFLAEAARAGKAVLGICLGAQLIASALGARVYGNPEKEIGWFSISAVSRCQECCRFPDCVQVLHWHGETFDLPPGATLLASSRACRHQAFQIGARVLGLQFHLEATPATVEAMISAGRHELVPHPYVQTEAQIRNAPQDAYAEANALMDRILNYMTEPR